MFTGLVERTGRISSVHKSSDAVWTLTVDPGVDFARQHGDSIAVNGVCLTEVGTSSQGPLTFHVSPETLKRTSLGALTNGAKVNLERSLRADARLGGHIVLGHVDDKGIIQKLEPQEGFYLLEVLIPTKFAKYVVEKGSIAIDGTSLTINNVSDLSNGCLISFMLIPVTWEKTRLSECRVQDAVNIEIDMVAKHIERLTKAWNPA